MTREDEVLQNLVEIVPVDEPTYRVTFERDEGQQYSVGARVTVHAMNGLFRTVDLNPSAGNYLVMRCEPIRDAGWKALRVSLHLVNPPGSGAVLSSAGVDGAR